MDTVQDPANLLMRPHACSDLVVDLPPTGPSPPGPARLCVRGPAKLPIRHYCASPEAIYHLHTIQDRLHGILGRQPSSSVIIRRALEAYATHLSRIRSASGSGREIKRVMRHVRGG